MNISFLFILALFVFSFSQCDGGTSSCPCKGNEQQKSCGSVSCCLANCSGRSKVRETEELISFSGKLEFDPEAYLQIAYATEVAFPSLSYDITYFPKRYDSPLPFSVALNTNYELELFSLKQN